MGRPILRLLLSLLAVAILLLLWRWRSLPCLQHTETAAVTNSNPLLPRHQGFVKGEIAATCPDNPEPLLRTRLWIAFAPATGHTTRKAILRRLGATVIDSGSHSGGRAVTVELPDSTSCAGRDEALRWLRARADVIETGAIRIMRPV